MEVVQQGGEDSLQGDLADGGYTFHGQCRGWSCFSLKGSVSRLCLTVIIIFCFLKAGNVILQLEFTDNNCLATEIYFRPSNFFSHFFLFKLGQSPGLFCWGLGRVDIFPYISDSYKFFLSGSSQKANKNVDVPGRKAMGNKSIFLGLSQTFL